MLFEYFSYKKYLHAALRAYPCRSAYLHELASSAVIYFNVRPLWLYLLSLKFLN